MRRRPITLFITLVGVLVVPGAEAQSDPSSAKERAYQVFKRGNALYMGGRYGEALAAYEIAVAIYDHPRIRLQIARTLALDLLKPRQAFPHLRSIMTELHRLEPDEQRRARRLRSVLLGQLGFVRVVCQTPGADVSLDGVPVGCGRQAHVVTAGKHQLVGKKAGHLPTTARVFVEPSKETRVRVRLTALADATEKRRRWAVWKPLVVVGGGALLGVAGFSLFRRSATNYARFRARVETECGPELCTPTRETLAIEDRAILQNRIAAVVSVAAGLAMTGGLVLLYANRQRAVLMERSTRTEATVSFAPTLVRGGGGVVLGASF